MKKTINDALINAISSKIPSHTNLASYLIDTLSISKEAAYRRLRGDVFFTFNEAATIVSNLDISLDQIVGNDMDTGAIINISMIKSSNDIQNYNETLEKYIKIGKTASKDPFSTFHEATNKLPIYFYSTYPFLTKFWISRWLHQSNNLIGTGSLEDIKIPKKTLDLHKQFAKQLRSIPTSIFIWDRNIFKSLVKGILYFANLNLFSSNDLDNLRNELFELLEELGSLMMNAQYKSGGKIYIYLCNIAIETIYGYIESKDIKISLLRIYAINLVDSKHPDIFKIQKDWVQSLRRYSTLITDSSEMERIKYLDQQREYINQLKI